MRPSNSFVTRLAVGALGLALMVSAARGQEYKIKLSRPVKVGDEYVTTVSAQSTQKMDVTINGQSQPLKNDTFKAALHGTVKVLAVNEKINGASRITITVDTLTRDGADLYPAGTIITAEKTGQKTSFVIDNAPVEDEKAEVLDTLINVDRADQTTSDDDLTGTDQPQKVGDTWPINADKLAKEISDNGLPLKGEDLKGESKLVEVKKVKDADVMVVQTTVTADGIKKDLPDGSSISDGTLKAEVTYTLPTDNTSPAISSGNKMHLVMTVDLPGGAGKASIVTDRQVNEDRAPVKQ